MVSEEIRIKKINQEDKSLGELVIVDKASLWSAVVAALCAKQNQEITNEKSDH